MNQRQELNRQILKALMIANELLPDQRFGQLLVNCEITSQEKRPDDRVVNTISYHEESSMILGRVLDQILMFEKRSKE